MKGRTAMFRWLAVMGVLAISWSSPSWGQGVTPGAGGGGAITAAAGSYSAGALVDGASVTQGTKGDTAYTGTGSASEIAIEKGIYNALVAPLPAGTNAIGSVSVSNFPTTQPVSGTVAITGTAGAGSGWNGYTIVPGATTGFFAPLVQGVIRAPTNGGLTAGNNQPIPITASGVIPVGIFSSAGTAIGATSSLGNSSSGAGAAIAALWNFNTTLAEGTTNSLLAQQGNQYGAGFVDTEGLKPSDSSFISFAPTTGVLWSLCGSSTKTIRIRYLYVEGNATAAGGYNVSVLKTSSAPTGGTATALTIVANSTVGATGSNTASGNAYTAAPTGGTSIGAVSGGILNLPVLGTAADPQNLLPQGASVGTQSIVLSGVAQCIEISTASTSVTGAVLDVWESHTEE
jgi:hypothetical protein